jgi:hypothetical protein
LDSSVDVYKQTTGAYAGSGWTGSDGTITFSLLEDIYKIRVRESNDIWVENVLVVYGSTGIIIGDDVNNTAPVIDSYSPPQTSLIINEGENITFTANASDPDGTNPQYRWSLDGTFQSALPTWTFYASYTDSGDRTVALEVTDGQYSVYQIWNVTVNNVNRNPIITSFYVDRLTAGTGDSINISVIAMDLDGDSLAYSWHATGGMISYYSSSSISWTAPTIEGYYSVDIAISDNNGGIIEDSVVITVTNDDPPFVAITFPDPGITVSTSTLMVTGTSSDPSGIASVTVNDVLASGAPDWSTWNADVAVVSGENTITVVATNTTGSTTTKIMAVTYSPHTPIPPVTLSTALSGRYVIGEPIELGTTIQNTGASAADVTIDVRSTNGFSYTSTSNIPGGSGTSTTFNLGSAGIGIYDATVDLYVGSILLESNSKSFVVLDNGPLEFINRAEGLETTSIAEFDQMAGA